MNIAELKTYCDTLSRFASVREGAAEPTDRIIFQSVGGQLKLVAGTEYSTVIIDCGKSLGDDAMALVSARTLLQWVKGLRGKGDVVFTGSGKGLVAESSTGARVSLPNVASSLPAFDRPPALVPFTGVPTAKSFWPDVVGVVDAAKGDIAPFTDVAFSALDDTITLAVASPYTYAELPMTAPHWVGYDGPMGAVPAGFITALRSFKDEGDIRFSEDLVVVRNGFYQAVCKLDVKHPGYPAHENFAASKTTWVDTSKRSLVDMLKGVSTQDPHGRVRLTASEGKLKLSPWSAPDVGVEVPAFVRGTGGSVGTLSGLFTKLVASLSGTQAAFAFTAEGAGSDIEFKDAKWPWRTALSTVAL